jgi:hypothetical protein
MKKEKIHRISVKEFFARNNIPEAGFTGDWKIDKKRFSSGNYCLRIGYMKKKVSYLFITYVAGDYVCAGGITIKKQNLSRKVRPDDIVKAGWNFQPWEAAGAIEKEVGDFFFNDQNSHMHLNLSPEGRIKGFSNREDFFNLIYKCTKIVAMKNDTLLPVNLKQLFKDN